MKYFFTLSLVFCVCIGIRAQIFAVQSTSQLIPPYSVYLSDYATPGSEKLRVILVQRDLTQPSYQLRLVMEVMLNGKTILRTSRTFNPPPISLNPGIPTIISGADLAPYLDSRNIDFIGFSREQYERTRALPEGSYQINFTAYDFRRQDVVVSNVGSSFYYLSKNEPPLINFPACGSQVQLRTPQQIIFSWLPRNTASPNSAAETQYEFTLYETRPAGRNPNDVVASTQPILRTTVDNPQLIYGATEPMLMDNMKYVWRVRAIDREGKDAFRNNGYSEVCTFTYGGVDPNFSIGVVTGVQAEGETERRAKISWTKGDFDSYRVNYKKTGSGYEWFYDDVTKEKLLQDGTVNGELKVFDLEPDTEYETRIQGKKSGVAGGYSDIIKFRTQPLRVAHCGDAPPPPVENTGKPATNILIGTIIDADGFDIQLTQVESLGGGFFKGVGRTSVKYLGGASFAVKFERLYINEDRVAGTGRIDFISNGVMTQIENQMANAQLKVVNKVKEDNRAAWTGTIFYERVFVYDQMEIEKVEPSGVSMVNVYKRDGTVTANAEVMQVLNSVPEKAIIIQDKSGDQFVVQKDKATGAIKATKVEGGGLMVGSDGKMMTEKDIKNLRKLIFATLKEFKIAIEEYLAINTPDTQQGGKKSTAKIDLSMFAAKLPECMEPHKDQLEPIYKKIKIVSDSMTRESQEFVVAVTAKVTENGIANASKVKPKVCEELVKDYEVSPTTSIDPEIERYAIERAKYISQRTIGVIYGLLYCKKCNEPKTPLTKRILNDRSALVTNKLERCIIVFYDDKTSTSSFMPSETLKDELSFTSNRGYNSKGEAFFGITNRNDNPFDRYVSCTDYLDQALSTWNYCDQEPDKAQIDLLFNSLDQCIFKNNISSVVSNLDGKIETSVDPSGKLKIKINRAYLQELQLKNPALFDPSIWDELEKAIQEQLDKARLTLCDAASSSRHCVDKQLNFLQVINLNMQSLAENNTIDKAMWSEGGARRILPSYAQWNAPGGGVVDGLVDEGAGIVLLVKTIGEISLDREKQQQIGKIFTREGITKLGQSLKEDILKTINDPTKRSYTVTKATVTIVFLFYSLTSQAGKQLDNILAKADDLAGKIENAPNLRNQLTKLVEAKDIAKIDHISKLIDDLGAEKLERILAKVDDHQVEGLLQDLAGNPAFKGAIKNSEQLVDSWKLLNDAGRTGLKTNVNALEALNRIRKNAKLGDLKITDDMLSKIEGIPNVSYAQILDDLDIAIKALPEGKVVNFHKVISDGQRGLVNSKNVWDRRHSWLTLKKIKENEAFLKNADEIKFEVELEQIDGISNAVPDIVVSKTDISNQAQIRFIGEVKAGDNVITSNFNNQTIRYFQDTDDIRNLRFFRRDGVTLTKQQVIDSWKSGVTSNKKVRDLFTDYSKRINDIELDASFTQTQLENFLSKNDNWFDLIFNSSF